MTEKKHGGKREGAGRKATGVVASQRVSMRVAPDEWVLIKAQAEKENKAVSRFLVDCALEKITH